MNMELYERGEKQIIKIQILSIIFLGSKEQAFCKYYQQISQMKSVVDNAEDLNVGNAMLNILSKFEVPPVSIEPIKRELEKSIDEASIILGEIDNVNDSTYKKLNKEALKAKDLISEYEKQIPILYEMFKE